MPRKQQKGEIIRFRPQIPAKVFQPIVERILKNIDANLGFEDDAIKALQNGAEEYMLEVYSAALKIKQDDNRRQIQPKDMQQAVRSMEKGGGKN